MTGKEDVFGRGDYRRMIGWSQRLEREQPFLERFLAQAVSGRLLDLGCGSGEHAAWLSDRGAEVVGVDQSAAQIASARELCTPERPKLRFVESDFANLHAHLSGHFGGALCLGNVLPFLDATQLDLALHQWALLLQPGAPLWIQLLNYAGLRARGVRQLPLLVSPSEAAGGEEVLLRFLRFAGESEVLFFPTTLQMPADDSAPQLLRARGVRLQTWSTTRLPQHMARAGFGQLEFYGGVDFSPYDAVQSSDLVVCARRT